ncbi:unnamed protein product [Lepidochelys kempii]
MKFNIPFSDASITGHCQRQDTVIDGPLIWYSSFCDFPFSPVPPILTFQQGKKNSIWLQKFQISNDLLGELQGMESQGMKQNKDCRLMLAWRNRSQKDKSRASFEEGKQRWLLWGRTSEFQKYTPTSFLSAAVPNVEVVRKQEVLELFLLMRPV